MGDRGYGVFFDITTLTGQSVYLFTWYLISIGLSMWGVAALAMQDVEAITPAAVGWLMPLLTALVHLSLLGFGYFLVDGYVLYPVWPMQLFAAVDGLIALMFVLSIVGLAINSLALLMVVNGLLVPSYMLACFKYYVIVTDVRSGRRNSRTGALRV